MYAVLLLSIYTCQDVAEAGKVHSVYAREESLTTTVSTVGGGGDTLRMGRRRAQHPPVYIELDSTFWIVRMRRYAALSPPGMWWAERQRLKEFPDHHDQQASPRRRRLLAYLSTASFDIILSLECDCIQYFVCSNVSIVQSSRGTEAI